MRTGATSTPRSHKPPLRSHKRARLVSAKKSVKPGILIIDERNCAKRASCACLRPGPTPWGWL